MKRSVSVTALLLVLNSAYGGEPSVKAGDDFYHYANNPWLSEAKIPDGASKIDTSAELRALNKGRVRSLVEQAAAAGAKGDKVERLVGAFYASFLDSSRIEALGLSPIEKDLAAIAAISDRRTLSAYLGAIIGLGDGAGTAGDAPLGVWVHQGFSEAELYMPHLQQGGLGLGDREAYLAESPAQYKAYLRKLFELLAVPDPSASAEHVLSIETAMARTQATQADTDDVYKDNNVWTPADFTVRAPGLDWTVFLHSAGLSGARNFVVWQPSAVTGLAKLAEETPLDVWKDYFRARLIHHYEAALPDKFHQPMSAKPDALALTEASLGEPLGKLYVRRYFSPAAKEAARAMVANIRAVFAKHIPTRSWMSAETRTKALAKLATLEVGLGYPDHWTNDAGLEAVQGDALGNLRRAEAFALHTQLAEIGYKADPAEWSITPQSVGAILDLSPNAMKFSAGLLQPPYFDPKGDAATNYGSAGAGLSHEVSHTFDEVGNLYDERGRLVSWWTDQDKKGFAAAAAPLAAQFGAYCPEAEHCVDASRTLSENVADLGGLTIAYEAYHRSLKGKADRVIDGLTGDQRFFLSFARRWRVRLTPEALKKQLASDIHAPGEFRADTVRNIEGWYKAFGVGPGDKLYLPPEARVSVW